MHHFSICARIFICSMTIKNMKKIVEITFCLIVLLGILVFLETWFLNSYKDHQGSTEIRCSGMIQEDCWNSGFADDNEVELKSHFRLIVMGEQPTINFSADIFSRPKQPFLLNPLFSDRPPPAFCS